MISADYIRKIKSNTITDTEWEEVYEMIYLSFHKKASSLTIEQVCLYLSKMRNT